MSTVPRVDVAIAAPPHRTPASRVQALVYNGPGAGTRSVQSTIHSLRAALQSTITVRTIDATTLVRGEWRDDCCLLVIPGGADLPYCKYLNGIGTQMIREYVETGGCYLGLCAGAYFACKRVEFEVGTPLEVKGDRELAFYPGVARGSLFPGFTYESEEGAVAATIQYIDRQSTWQWRECKDYVNGGPAFIHGEEGSLPANFKVLATFLDHDADLDAPSPPAPATAALACKVGLGRAILCASHPELSTSWLRLPSGAVRSDAVGLSDEILTMCHPSTNLTRELETCKLERWGFWLTLLDAAGLSSHFTTETSKNPYMTFQRDEKADNVECRCQN